MAEVSSYCDVDQQLQETFSGVQWLSIRSMPTKRVFSTAIVHGGKIYVFGGCDSKGQPLDIAEVYSPESHTWKSLNPMPSKKAGCSAAAVGDHIYTLGGVSQSQMPLDKFEVYSIKERKWHILDSLPECLLGSAVFVRDDKIYAVGGMGLDASPKEYFLCYDIASEKWKSLPGLPTERYAASAFLVEDSLYIIGGRQGKLPTDAFEVFSFSTCTWEILPKIPSKRVFAMYSYYDNMIISIGGLHQPALHGFADCCQIFHIRKNLWVEGRNMKVARGDFAIGCLGGKILCAGGIGKNGDLLTSVECYDPTSDQWCDLPDMLTTHGSCAYVCLDNHLFVIGGLSDAGPSACVESIQLT